MCANRSPHYNPWHPRKRLAEAKAEIQAVPPGSTCLAGTRIDFNWTGVKYAEIDVEIDRCNAEIQSGSVATTPSRIATGSSVMLQRRCIELAQIRRGEIWGGVAKSGRAWGLIPGHFYLRTEEGKERAAAIRACTTNTTSPNRGPKDAVIQRVIVDFDEVEECMREQGWQRLL